MWPTIIMYNLKKIILTFAILTLFSVESALSQTSKIVNKQKFRLKRNYSLVLYVGSGIAQYVANINTQPIGLQTNIMQTSAYETFRVMWHPNHRLRVGLESGYTNFYSYNLINANSLGSVKLTAIPLLIVASIKIVNRVNLFAGFGTYFLTTHLNYHGQLTSHATSLGSNIALNYVQPLNKNVGIAFETKWVNAFQTKDNMLAAQVELVWKFLNY